MVTANKTNARILYFNEQVKTNDFWLWMRTRK